MRVSVVDLVNRIRIGRLVGEQVLTQLGLNFRNPVAGDVNCRHPKFAVGLSVVYNERRRLSRFIGFNHL